MAGNNLRNIPNNLPAEEAVIGCCLLKRDALEPVLEIIDSSFFYRPLYGQIFAAIEDLYEHGDTIDATTVMSRLRKNGIKDEEVGPLLIRLMAEVPTISGAYEYAKLVERSKLSRDVMRMAQDVLGEVSDDIDPLDISDRWIQSLAALGTAEVVQKAKTAEEFIEMKYNDELSPLIIPGIMRKNYRAVITARSGVGKSFFGKMIGYCAAQGVHPFTRKDIEPIKTLTVDAENPEENIIQALEPLQRTLTKRSPVYDAERFKIVSQPGGMNIRQRRGRADFQREIAIHQPDLVIIGPAYKMGAKGLHGESWEDAASEWLAVLDHFRTKYEFGLIIEAHTSKGEGFDPQGSAYFTQWPEIGLALKRNEGENITTVEKWRPDRLQGLGWPTTLAWDDDWLFESVYT